MHAITGANGRLGRLVIAALLKSVPATEIVALVRDPAKAADLAAQDIAIRQADYDHPAGLPSALAGIDRLLFIASHELGRRVTQHQAVIDAANAAHVGRIVYTSVLRASTSPLGIAEEHRQTEVLLAKSGIPFVLLRNGWYTENYTVSITPALEQGVILGSTGGGRVSPAARADYAEAAAAALVDQEDKPERTYELAGDDAFTMEEFAAELSRQSGREVRYRDLPEADYKASLIEAGIPEIYATPFARSSAVARDGALFDDHHELSDLIGRPTTPMRDVIAAALKV